MKKRLLILGASILQLPAIIKAKEMGLYVGVIDYDKNAIGALYADKFYEVSTIDEDNAYQAALDFCPDGVMTLATDAPIRTVAYIAEKLKLSSISYRTAVNSTDKLKMIQIFQNNNVAHPWFISFKENDDIKEIIQKIKYPCICKPVDSSGSRGVVLIEKEEELIDSIQYSLKNSRKKEVILEEFLKGKEISVEVIIYNSEIHILNVTDKLTTGAPYFVEMGHTQPSSLSNDKIEKIIELVKKAIEALNITQGAAHVEIMYTEDGPKIIEIGARMGGDCISTHLVPLTTGINMTEAVIRISLGEIPNLTKTKNNFSAIRYIDADSGIIKKIEGINTANEVLGITEVRINKKIGDHYNGVKSSIDRIGYVISNAKSYNDAISICEFALKKIKIVTGD